MSIGVADTQQQLRTALAMGADRAILVQTDAAVEPLTAAQTFLALAKKENPDLIFLGKQAIDDDANQTGQMLAAIWERPQATYASKVEIDGGKVQVTREVDAGLETIEVDLPAVITVDLRLNEPRYVKLPDIMKAKKKPLDVTSLDALGVSAGELHQDREDRAAAAAPERRDGEGRGGIGRRTQEEGFDLMHKILIIGEHDGKTLNPATAKCVTCAKAIPDAEITHRAARARTPRRSPRRPPRSPA